MQHYTWIMKLDVARWYKSLAALPSDLPFSRISSTPFITPKLVLSQNQPVFWNKVQWFTADNEGKVNPRCRINWYKDIVSQNCEFIKMFTALDIFACWVGF